MKAFEVVFLPLPVVDRRDVSYPRPTRMALQAAGPRCGPVIQKQLPLCAGRTLDQGLPPSNAHDRLTHITSAHHAPRHRRQAEPERQVRSQHRQRRVPDRLG